MPEAPLSTAEDREQNTHFFLSNTVPDQGSASQQRVLQQPTAGLQMSSAPCVPPTPFQMQ